MARRGAAALGLSACLAACSAPEPDLGPPPYDRLSDYRFFTGALRDLQPAEGVLPYLVVSPLWSDGAGKARFVVPPTPPGAPGEGTVTFDPGEVWGFAPGTTLVKNFFFDLDRSDGAEGPFRVVETRLLIKRDGPGWDPYTYVWQDDESDARRVRAGDRIAIDHVDAVGQPAVQEYIVPNEDECDTCHARDDVTHTVGLVTHQVNFEGTLGDGSSGNQLQWLADAGLFDGPLPDLASLPALADPFGAADLDSRARAYLHSNCGHCHRPDGDAAQAGLVLTAFDPDPPPVQLGICKVPAAAGPGTGGRSFDVVPGAPEESIVLFRMESTDPEIKMPEVGNLLPNQAGIDLVREWIASLEPAGCP